jgi:hypothetical protein
MRLLEPWYEFDANSLDYTMGQGICHSFYLHIALAWAIFFRRFMITGKLGKYENKDLRFIGFALGCSASGSD